MNLPRLTVRSLRAVPVMVPMTYALGMSAATVRTAPLLLVDLETHEGITGRAYQFCYTAAAKTDGLHFRDQRREFASRFTRKRRGLTPRDQRVIGAPNNLPLRSAPVDGGAGTPRCRTTLSSELSRAADDT